MELKRRRVKGKTVYGIYSSKGDLLRCIQENNGEYIEVNKKPTITVMEKLEPFITKKKRYKVAYGGRGSGKSETFGGIQLCQAKDYGIKTACFREYQNSIEDSVYALLKGKIESSGLCGFEDTKNEICHVNGANFKFRGLARNIEAIKSLFGFKRFWVEEAQTISKDSLTKLKPTLRIEGSELWLSLNPLSSADPIAEDFLKPFEKELDKNGYYEDELHLIVRLNYDDNPWFPDVLEQERLRDKELLSDAEYEHIWEGAYKDTVEGSIIPSKWFDAAVDAHLKLGFKPEGDRVISHDPSDEGEDPKGLAYRHGSVFLDIKERDHGDLADGGDWAIDYAIDMNADLFTWDCDGMGVGINRQVNKSFQGKRCQLMQFKGSNTPDEPDAVYERPDKVNVDKIKTNKEAFYNKRAQYYWKLRDRFFNAYRAIVKKEYVNPDEMISISSEIENIAQIRSEICRIPKKPNGNGKIQIMSKKEMWDKHKIKSPNMADSMMMSMESTGGRSIYDDDDYEDEGTWRTA